MLTVSNFAVLIIAREKFEFIYRVNITQTNFVGSMSNLLKAPTTKDKLASIVQGFDEFDSEMKVGTRVTIIL